MLLQNKTTLLASALHFVHTEFEAASQHKCAAVDKYASILIESYRPLPITVDIFRIYYLLLETLQRNDKQR